MLAFFHISWFRIFIIPYGSHLGSENNIVINNIFAFQVTSNIIRNDKDLEPRNVEECQHRNDWTKWKEAIQVELNSLTKREVFGLVIQTPKDVKSVGYKWVFVRKHNENNEIIRYKV